MQRKLKVDGSGLWLEPENQFILRFNDMNENRQSKFAERFKKTAKESKLLNPHGPSEQDILSFLKEVNPIIYSEGRSRFNNSWQRWNATSIYTLSGRSFRKLRKMVYRFLCLKRQPYLYEIEETLKLSISCLELNPQEKETLLINTHALLAQLQTEENSRQSRQEKRNKIPSEINMLEVQQAREHAEHRMFRI